MTKSRLYLDCDNTITNSTKAFCDAYNIIYRHHKNFIPAQWELVQSWNFEDQCGNCLKSHSDVLEIFEHPTFFKFLKLIDSYTYRVASELAEKYQIIIVSIGTPKNLSLKALYLNETLPFIKDYILISNEGCKMDKSIIQMNYPDSIFIDDVTTNIESSNAQRKYIFGQEYPWSQTKNFNRLWDWTDIHKELL